MMPMMMQMMQGRMMGAGMPDMGLPMARGAMALQHIEGQVAFYKAELRIMDAQAAQWVAFADTLRANAKRLQDAYKSGASTRRRHAVSARPVDEAPAVSHGTA